MSNKTTTPGRSDDEPRRETVDLRRTSPLLKSILPLVGPFSSCAVCGAGDLWPLDATKRYLALGCTGCGLVQTWPQPDEERLRAYYESENGWERAKAWPDGEALNKWLKRRRRAYEEEVDLLLDQFSLPGSRGSRPLRVLDFGCGLGVMLGAFAARGFETFGLEPAPASARIAGLHHRLLTELPSEPTFDLIVAVHVLEHVRRPLEVVSSLAAATLEGGLIYVAVPHFERLPEHGQFRHLLNLQHLFAYTMPAMRALLGRGGFTEAEELRSDAWATVRDSVKSMRCVGRRTDRRPMTDESRPLDAAIFALRKFADTKFARERLQAERTKRKQSSK